MDVFSAEKVELDKVKSLIKTFIKFDFLICSEVKTIFGFYDLRFGKKKK